MLPCSQHRATYEMGYQCHSISRAWGASWILLGGSCVRPREVYAQDELDSRYVCSVGDASTVPPSDLYDRPGALPAIFWIVRQQTLLCAGILRLPRYDLTCAAPVPHRGLVTPISGSKPYLRHIRRTHAHGCHHLRTRGGYRVSASVLNTDSDGSVGQLTLTAMAIQ